MRFPISDGIDVNRLSSIRSSVKRRRFTISDGIDVNILFFITRQVKLTRFPISGGTREDHGYLFLFLLNPVKVVVSHGIKES